MGVGRCRPSMRGGVLERTLACFETAQCLLKEGGGRGGFMGLPEHSTASEQLLGL